jgi:hypothetical protein
MFHNRVLMLSNKYTQQQQQPLRHNPYDSSHSKNALAATLFPHHMPPRVSVPLQHHQLGAAVPGGTTGRALRRQRKSNFSNGEVEILVREVAARRDVLFGGRSRATSANGLSKSCEKMGRWREIAAAVNSAQIGEKRTVREVRKIYYYKNIFSIPRLINLLRKSFTLFLWQPHL